MMPHWQVTSIHSEGTAMRSTPTWMLLAAKAAILLALTGLLLMGAVAQEYKSGKVWEVPQQITPGVDGGPPSDAIVLFDGHDLSQWEGGDKWLIENGVATTRGG